MSIRDIEALDCELAVYRKGFLSVHIDFARGYMTWRESKTWTNNFTRSLRPEQIESLRQRLMCSLERIDLPDMAHQPTASSRLRLRITCQLSCALACDDSNGKIAWALVKNTIGIARARQRFLPRRQELSRQSRPSAACPFHFR
jgi:hypothetical protein